MRQGWIGFGKKMRLAMEKHQQDEMLAKFREAISDVCLFNSSHMSYKMFWGQQIVNIENV